MAFATRLKSRGANKHNVLIFRLDYMVDGYIITRGSKAELNR